MGFTRSYIRDENDQITAVRDTRDDGRVSYVYEHNDSVLNDLPFLDTERGELIEKQYHDEDGTTRSEKP